MLEMYGVAAVCGTTKIVTFLLLGPVALALGIVLVFVRKKISQPLFVTLEIIFGLLFLLYTVRYEYYKCSPSMGGGYIHEYHYRLFPQNILPIHVR